ncbi:hypothetical protein DPMN_115945 [Dreissena polymorpha]|uniref:Uncharacterized protein n=1 Tax=Dreissena polymorpha TaxID=45954 RepID=A0A9D4KM57_DREPO|nr:hypothetical protein DPMN_115945 [Dreissena polymorpha]
MTSFLDEEFDDIGEVPQPKRIKDISSIVITNIKQQNTEETTNKRIKWAVNMLKVYLEYPGYMVHVSILKIVPEPTMTNRAPLSLMNRLKKLNRQYLTKFLVWLLSRDRKF